MKGLLLAMVFGIVAVNFFTWLGAGVWLALGLTVVAWGVCEVFAALITGFYFGFRDAWRYHRGSR